MNNKVSFILLFTSLLLSSCSTYNKVHPLSSVCSYKDGIWGNWKSTISFNSYDYSVRTQYNSQYLTVYIYKSYSHPSETIYIIGADKLTKFKTALNINTTSNHVFIATASFYLF